MARYLSQKLKLLLDYLRSHRAITIVAALFFVVGVCVLVGYAHPAIADSPAGNTPYSGGPLSDVADAILRALIHVGLAISRFFLSVTIFILTFIIEVSGYNGYIDSQAVNVGWVMVRDLTNMFFIIAMLVIAIGTILGVEKYEWKHMLVELVLAAVLVNFSRTICGLIIDASQVVMNTFVNGIAATAAGNLIQAFDLAGIQKISPNVVGTQLTITNELIAAVGAVFFSSMVMCLMGGFLIMLVIRLIVLWILIVLSPLGFTLTVLPETHHYASEWWETFTKNIIMGPVLLFFVWLSFVTVGNGRINSEINDPQYNSAPQDTTTVDGAGEQSSGIGSVMRWSDMANFVIACAMLAVGAKVAGHIGGMGAEYLEHGVDYGKKIAGYASGLNAARWTGSNVALPMAKTLTGYNFARRMGTRAYGKVGQKFYQLQARRNNMAKDIDEINEEKRKLEFNKRNGSLGRERYMEEMEKLETDFKSGNLQGGEAEFKKKAKDLLEARDSGALNDQVYKEKLDKWKGKSNILSRGARGVLASIVQTGDRSDKIAHDALEAMEAEQEAYKGDFSTSSFGPGQDKYFAEVKAEMVKHRGQAKKATKIANVEMSYVEEGRRAAEALHHAKKGTSEYEEAEKRASKSLGYTAVKAHEQQHATEAQKEEMDKLLERDFGHGEGDKLHRQALRAQMGRDNAKAEIDTHGAQIELAYVTGELGKLLLSARAAFDAQTNAVTTAKQQLLSGIREERAAKAFGVVKKEVEKAAEAAKAEKGEGGKDVTKIEDPVKRAEVERAVADASRKVLEKYALGDEKNHVHGNPEIASALFKTYQDEKKILEDSSRTKLEDEVVDRIIGAEQRIRFPDAAWRKAVDGIKPWLKGIDRETLVDSYANHLQAIVDKRARAGKDKSYVYTGSEEERKDRMYTMALASELQEQRYWDDTTGSAEGALTGGQKEIRERITRLEQDESVKKDVEEGKKYARTLTAQGESLGGLKQLLQMQGNIQRNQLVGIINSLTQKGAIGGTKSVEDLLKQIRTGGLDQVKLAIKNLTDAEKGGQRMTEMEERTMANYLRIMADATQDHSRDSELAQVLKNIFG